MSPPPCPRCGGPQGELFSSFFCKRDCDRKKVKPAHKRDLGNGWVLWTENETPPFGWTHAILVDAESLMKGPTFWEGHKYISRPDWERAVRSGHGGHNTVVTEGRPKSLELELRWIGIAYKVPKP